MAKAQDGDYLSRSIDLMWGRTAPGRRGPKPQISVEQIARTAIGLADAEGLSALSMQRIASELGFTAMSLYTYVPSKDLLIAVMLDLAAEPHTTPVEHDDWRAGVHEWVSEVWNLFTAHPWALQVSVSGPPLGPHQMALFERLLSALAKSGLPKAELFNTGMFLLSAVRGMCKLALDMIEYGAGSAVEFDTQARKVMSPERFPTMYAAFTAEEGEPEELTTTEVPQIVGYGVDRLMDGIEARAASDGG